MPPEASSLICVAPFRSCSRAARRTSSAPSTISGRATRPGIETPAWIASCCARRSPWPPVCVRTDPDGRIRGPRNIPVATARAQAGSSPPASRTVVNPSSSAPSIMARTLRTCNTHGSVPWSPRGPINARWIWASVRPGSSVQPVPSMVSVAAGSRWLPAGWIEAIRPSRTRTSMRPPGSRPVPSSTAASRITASPMPAPDSGSFMRALPPAAAARGHRRPEGRRAEAAGCAGAPFRPRQPSSARD